MLMGFLLIMINKNRVDSFLLVKQLNYAYEKY